MKISIIIPVYNVADYVEQCIKSVLNQTFKQIEVIIVDDCSTDNSMGIVRKTLKHTDTSMAVKIIRHEMNRGLSVARNTGILHSSGDYLYFLDSDDEITEDCINLLVSSLSTAPHADIVIGDYKAINTDSFYPPLKLKGTVLKGHDTIIKAYMKENIYVMAWNRLIKKNFIVRHNLYFKEGLVHEDVLWSFQCMCMAECITVVKKKTYLYKVRKGSITSDIRFEDNFQVLMKVIRYMVDFASECSLLYNKYVHSYIEKKKYELLLLCLESGRCKNKLKPVLYNFISLLPHAGLCRIFVWEFFSIKKLMRDAHYFIEHDTKKADYYWSVPILCQGHLSIRKQLCFYAWFIKICFSRIVRTIVC